MSAYYVEVTDKLPFAVRVRLLERHVPHIVAVWLTCWWGFRSKIRFPAKPLSATRWDPQVNWKRREDMPPQALSRWSPIMENLEDLTFTICGWLQSDTIGAKEEAAAFLLNSSGNTLATLLWLRMGVVEQTLVTLTSWWNDGTEIITAALPRDQQLLSDVISPNYVRLLCEPARTSAAKLCQIHAERPELKQAMQFTGRSLQTHYEQQRIRLFQYGLEAGFLRGLSDREVAFLRD